MPDVVPPNLGTGRTAPMHPTDGPSAALFLMGRTSTLGAYRDGPRKAAKSEDTPDTFTSDCRDNLALREIPDRS